MGAFAKLLKDFEETCAALHISGKVCNIESFDKKKMRASIQPLGRRRVGDDVQKWPIISNVPVSFLLTGSGEFIRPDFSRLDLVFAVWANRDIKGPLKGEDNDESVTLFSAENAVVLGSVSKTAVIAPSAFGNSGLLIGSDGAFVQFFAGLIKIGSADAIQPFVLGNSIDAYLRADRTAQDTHTHLSGAPGSPTGPPIIPGPSVPNIKSSKIFGE